MTNMGKIDASLLTDTGQARSHNEDFVQAREPVDEEDSRVNGFVYIVADGVGGADAGEVASRFATERVVHHYINSDKEKDRAKRMRNAFFSANKELRDMAAARDENSRMATTMVAAVIHRDDALFTNVGDSRGYHWRDGNLRQITKDHSLVAKLVEEEVLTEEEALNYPRPNVILYSLGSEQKPQIDSFAVSLVEGDIVLLCSDGLTRHVADNEISQFLEDEPQANSAASKLLNLANDRGGHDNISVAVIHYGVKGAAPTKKLPATANVSQPSQWAMWALTGFLSILLIAGIVYIWLKILELG